MMNAAVFLFGLAMLMAGLWLLGPHVALIVGGSVLMIAVSCDSVVRMMGAKKK